MTESTTYHLIKSLAGALFAYSSNHDITYGLVKEARAWLDTNRESKVLKIGIAGSNAVAQPLREEVERHG